MMLDIVSKSSKEVRLIKVVDTMDNLSDPIPDLENSLRYKQFIKK
jgi:dihydroorotase